MQSILVVDDNPDACRVLVKLLIAGGDSSVGRCDGKAALEYLIDHIPSLVILDVMMPGMDGIEVLQSIRGNLRTAAIPVIMFSAISDPEFASYARKKGANDFWIKSKFDFSTLHILVAPYVAAAALN